MKITHLFFLLFKGDRYIDNQILKTTMFYEDVSIGWYFFLEMEIVQLYRPC